MRWSALPAALAVLSTVLLAAMPFTLATGAGAPSVDYDLLPLLAAPVAVLAFFAALGGLGRIARAIP